MASLEEIQRRQRAMHELARQIASEKDPETILALARRMEQSAEELLEQGRALETAFAQPRSAGQTRVKLTGEQRERVAGSTGKAVDVLELDASWDTKMPRTSPATIERLAMASVAERTMAEATRKQVEAVVAELERLPDLPPETKAAIDAFRARQLSRS